MKTISDWCRRHWIGEDDTKSDFSPRRFRVYGPRGALFFTITRCFRVRAAAVVWSSEGGGAVVIVVLAYHGAIMLLLG